MAPTMTTVTQAPSYVAPPVMVQQTPSYVAPPAFGYAPTMPAVPMKPPAPMAPPKLTEGIPDPGQIEQQKKAYQVALDKQLQDAIATVQQETDIEKKMVAFKTQKDIALYELQIDEKLVEQMGLEDERAAIATSELNKARVDRTIQLDNQASNLVLDYNMKVVMDDCMKKKMAFEQQYMAAENKLAQDFGKAYMTAHGAPGYTGPAPVVPGPKPTPGPHPTPTPGHHPKPAPHPHGKPTHGAV